ncbi:MAG: PD-(D/E)XK nuclease family protein [Dehalococcoidales bacterium]
MERYIDLGEAVTYPELKIVIDKIKRRPGPMQAILESKDGGTEIPFETKLSAGTLTGTVDFIGTHEGETVVIDWKSGRQMMLPKIQHDLQMAAYAVLAAANGWATPMRVIRYRTKYPDYQEMLLDDEFLVETGAKIEAAVAIAAAQRNALVVGVWCTGCFNRGCCSAHLTTANPAVYYEGREIKDHALACCLLKAVPALKDKIRSIEESCERLVIESGKSIPDPETGKSWGHHSGGRDQLDQDKLRVFLARTLGPGQPLPPGRLTKAACNNELKIAGYTEAEVTNFWGRARGFGAVVKRSISKLGWFFADPWR